MRVYSPFPLFSLVLDHSDDRLRYHSKVSNGQQPVHRVPLHTCRQPNDQQTVDQQHKAHGHRFDDVNQQHYVPIVNPLEKKKKSPLSKIVEEYMNPLWLLLKRKTRPSMFCACFCKW